MGTEQREIIWSYGGGVQSVAILVLIAQGKLQRPDRAIMANTGRERTATWRYYEQHAKPVFDSIGLTLEIAGRELSKVDLYGHNGDLLLPCYTNTGKLPTFCSDEWKKLVVRRYLRNLGYGPDRPVINWLGFSLDEVHRIKPSDKKWIKNHWPLCFDYKRRRHECILEVVNFGLPEPPKSACWACPNLDNPEWIDIKTNDPADFAQAVALDYQIRKNDKRGGVYLHEDICPLDKVDFSVTKQPKPLWECANVCMT